MGAITKKHIVILGVIMGVIGAVLLLRSYAATGNQAFEAEAGQRVGTTSVCQQNGSTSGNSYVKLSQSCTAATATPTPTPTTGGGGEFDVYLAYADGNSHGYGHIPDPWKGSSNVNFQGRDDNGCCVATDDTHGWDGGAVRIVNTSGSSMTVGIEITDMDYCNRDWPSQTVAAGSTVIFTSTEYVATQGNPNSWDTSDADWSCRNTANTNNCNPIKGTVNLTINGTRHVYPDSEGILSALHSTGGSDSTCAGSHTPGIEYTPWTKVSLAPSGIGRNSLG